jgi:hypothetical protein
MPEFKKLSQIQNKSFATCLNESNFAPPYWPLPAIFIVN